MVRLLLRGVDGVAAPADLMSTTAQSGWTALHLAAAHNNTEAVEHLLMAATELRSRAGGHLLSMAVDIDGATALHYAAQSGHDAAVRMLLNHLQLADVAQQDKLGRTALHRAADNGRVAVVQLLLGCWPAAGEVNVGDNLVSLRDRKGRTAVDLAAEGGHTEVVELLRSPQYSDAATREPGQQHQEQLIRGSFHEKAIPDAHFPGAQR